VMTKKERMLTAITHREPDKVPKGELAIEGGIALQLLGKEYYDRLEPMDRELKVRDLLKIDFININEFPAEQIGEDEKGIKIYRSAFGDEFKDNGISFQMLKPALSDISDAPKYNVPDIRKCTTRMIDYYGKNSDLFLMAQISGPVSSLDWMLGMTDYMIYCMTDTDNVKILVEKVIEFEVGRAKIFIDHGANAILLADDIAFNTGLLLPPKIMEQVAYPYYKNMIQEIKRHKDIPVILHTDGYVYDVLDKIVECGFDGIHSLQPSAGMDIEKVKKNYGNALCLMGNIDLDYLLTFGKPNEVVAEVEKLIDIVAPGGGFILCTCNILINAVKPENAIAMYETAEEYGIYRRINR
jgi:uroporphyrinogen decarboxylase